MRSGTLILVIGVATATPYAQSTGSQGGGPTDQAGSTQGSGGREGTGGSQGSGGREGTGGTQGNGGREGTSGTPGNGGREGTSGTQVSSDRRDNRHTSDAASKQFVEKMLVANMAEIQLGQMAVAQATNPSVKSFAQMMVTDHTQANEELMPVAQQLGVQPPAQLDSKNRSVADRLAKLQGAEFDRQYMKAMVDAHKDAVKQTRPMVSNQNSRSQAGSAGTTTGTSGTRGSSSTGSTDAVSSAGGSDSSSSSSRSSSAEVGTSGAGAPSVGEYAAKALPIVEHHLEQAQQLEKTVGK